ncbi:unnamed protein product [Chrysoparadoxa australica]
MKTMRIAVFACLLAFSLAGNEEASASKEEAKVRRHEKLGRHGGNPMPGLAGKTREEALAAWEETKRTWDESEEANGHDEASQESSSLDESEAKQEQRRALRGRRKAARKAHMEEELKRHGHGRGKGKGKGKADAEQSHEEKLAARYILLPLLRLKASYCGSGCGCVPVTAMPNGPGSLLCIIAEA